MRALWKEQNFDILICLSNDAFDSVMTLENFKTSEVEYNAIVITLIYF